MAENRLYNEDCIGGARRHMPDGSVDLIISDPPYGIDGGSLDKHYNREESYVVGGYVDVPPEEYAEFSREWIAEAARILRPGGSIYVVSGYTNLHHVLNALHATDLVEVNHIIWKYNFGVYTTRKYVSSHYHILFWQKPGGRPTFNTCCRYGADEKSESGRSLNYRDREDVFVINREYKPGKVKNKNELPSELLIKMIQYSSDPGDLVCDMFLGGFSTAIVAKGMNRDYAGFEVSRPIYEMGMERIVRTEHGSMIGRLRAPAEGSGERPPLAGRITDYRRRIPRRHGRQVLIPPRHRAWREGRANIPFPRGPGRMDTTGSRRVHMMTSPALPRRPSATRAGRGPSASHRPTGGTERSGARPRILQYGRTRDSLAPPIPLYARLPIALPWSADTTRDSGRP